MKKLIQNILFLVLLSLFINCKPKLNSNESDLKRVWMLVEFQNFKKEDFIKNKAQLNFTNLKNPSANMGCNQISFEIELKQKTIKFINIRSTRMFCENGMELENEFLKSFAQYNSYAVEGQKLILTTSKKEKMIFVAQDWD